MPTAQLSYRHKCIIAKLFKLPWSHKLVLHSFIKHPSHKSVSISTEDLNETCTSCYVQIFARRADPEKIRKVQLSCMQALKRSSYLTDTEYQIFSTTSSVESKQKS